jgi:hypothetical protein
MNKLAAEQWRQIFELLDTVLDLPETLRAEPAAGSCRPAG